MTSKRLHTVLTVVIGLLFLTLVGGAYKVNSLLAAEAHNATSQKAKSQALAQEQIGLTAAKKSIAKYTELEKIAHAVVPEDKNQAEAVRELVNIASANGVKLASITFPASTLGNTATGAPATTTTPAPSQNSAATRLSQLQPVKNIPGVYQLVINVTSDSSQPVAYDKFIRFLSALERNRRTAQVSTITLQPDTKNRNLLNFTLSLNEYIKP